MGFGPACARRPERAAADLLPGRRGNLRTGEKCRALYKVEFGAVRVYRLLADGRRQISAFHLAGEVFGFEADNIHHFFAEAICATGLQALRVSRP